MYITFCSLIYKKSYQKYDEAKSIQNSTGTDLLSCFPSSFCFSQKLLVPPSPPQRTHNKAHPTPSPILFVTFFTKTTDSGHL